METVKVGDKVRVVARGYVHGFDVGSIVTVTGVCPDSIRATDGIVKWDLNPHEYEPIAPGLIVVGGEYTSYNGNEWKCIHIDGDNAWLAPAGMKSAAYVFKTDGTNVSQGGGDYNIKFEPVVEWVDTRFGVSLRNTAKEYGSDHHVVRIRFPLIDGSPDWSQAKVTPA